MTTLRIYILCCLVTVTACCRADSTASGTITTTEYRAELDRLLAATEQLDSSGSALPKTLHELPQSWRVRAGEQEFEISTEGLQRDLRRYENDKNSETAMAVRRRIESLRGEIDGFEEPAADVSAERKKLNEILARREFRDVRSPGWVDRFKQWLADVIWRILRKLVRSVAIPNVSSYFVYGLAAIALLILVYFGYRTIRRGRAEEQAIAKEPTPLMVKEATLADARAAAARSEWREAIHLAYWAGIFFMERQGMWRPDRARTPREYLRLISAGSGQRETLAKLTRIFELAWYAKRDADEQAFAQSLEQLEKLGCR